MKPARDAATGRLGGVLLALALVAGACGQTEPQAAPSAAPSAPVTDGAPPTSPTPPTAQPSPSPSPAPTASPLEPHDPYVPPEADIALAAKQLAGRVAQALTTYGPGEPADAVAADLVAPAQVADLVDAAAELHVADAASRGRVVYPQLGGLTETRISVMVVVEQELSHADGTLSSVTRALDVRLARDDPAAEWRFVELASAGGAPMARPDDLDPLAAAVVDDTRIELPDSARWDIYRGGVDEQVLEVMLALADRTPYSVVVLSSGHPVNVFDTERRSNHTRGRAVDVYAIDGMPVVEGREKGSPIWDASRWLFETGITELGSPWDFDEDAEPGESRSFTNYVHQDHLHIGFEPPEPDPSPSTSASHSPSEPG